MSFTQPATEREDLLHEALALARRGIKVFPCFMVDGGQCTCGDEDCKSPGKHPRIATGAKAASMNPDIIRSWFSRWHGRLNFGQTLHNRVVVDIDVAQGKPGMENWTALLAEEGRAERLPATHSIRTGRGGTQLIFRLPEGMEGGKRNGIANAANHFAVAVDCKSGPNAYIMVPGSVTDGVYAWITPDGVSDDDEEMCPEWLLELADAGRSPGSRSSGGASTGGSGATTGSGTPTVPTTGGSGSGGASRLIDLLQLEPAHPGRGNDWYTQVCGHYALLFRDRRDLFIWHCEIANGGSADPIRPVDAARVMESAWTMEHERSDKWPDELTDEGNARLFIREFGQEVRYVPDKGAWAGWQGGRWCFEPDSAPAYQRWVGIARAWRVRTDWPDEKKKRYEAHRRGSLSTHGFSSMISSSKLTAELRSPAAEFDAQAHLLGTPSSVIDLRDGSLRASRPEDRMTMSTAVEYGTGEPRQWMEFLLRIFDGDNELIRYFQQLAGYSLGGSQQHQILPYLHGQGANGKSVAMNVIRRVLGDYSCSVPSEFLMVQRNPPHPEAIAKLKGRRFALGSEVNRGDRFDEAKVKILTGGDGLTGRGMRENSFEFEPTHHLWLHGNHQPTVAAGGHSFWRRLRLIPFEVIIPEAEKDIHLTDKIIEQEGGRVLGWMVDGAIDAAGGLATPRRVLAATEEYEMEEDGVGRFLGERTRRIEPDHTAATRIPVAMLYQQFLMWADDEGLSWAKSMTKVKFSREVLIHQVEKVRAGGGTWAFDGLRMVKAGDVDE